MIYKVPGVSWWRGSIPIKEIAFAGLAGMEEEKLIWDVEFTVNKILTLQLDPYAGPVGIARDYMSLVRIDEFSQELVNSIKNPEQLTTPMGMTVLRFNADRNYRRYYEAIAKKAATRLTKVG